MKLINMNCKYCPPGQKMFSSCNATHPTICVNCPSGTFSSNYSHDTTCERCSSCMRKQVIKHHCTRTTNTKCTCPKGFIYNPYKPCMKCPEGTTSINNICSPAKEPPDPFSKKPPPGGGRKETGALNNYEGLTIGLSIGFLVLIIICAILFYLWYRKRAARGQHQTAVATPDLYKDIREETPELPHKKHHYHNVNAYAPNPHVSRKITPTPLSDSTFPAGLIDELSIMLDISQQINYRHLACALGLDERLMRVNKEQNPVEKLLNYYFTTKNPTKEELYEGLVEIKHYDAAEAVWEQLGPPKYTSPARNQRPMML